MELARLFCQSGSNHTIRLVAWGAEEGGFEGSAFYVRNVLIRINIAGDVFHRAFQSHRLCINLDTLGSARGTNWCYLYEKRSVEDC